MTTVPGTTFPETFSKTQAPTTNKKADSNDEGDAERDHDYQYMYSLAFSFFNEHPLGAGIDIMAQAEPSFGDIMDELLDDYPFLGDEDLPCISQALEDSLRVRVS